MQKFGSRAVLYYRSIAKADLEASDESILRDAFVELNLTRCYIMRVTGTRSVDIQDTGRLLIRPFIVRCMQSLNVLGYVRTYLK